MTFVMLWPATEYRRRIHGLDVYVYWFGIIKLLITRILNFIKGIFTPEE